MWLALLLNLEIKVVKEALKRLKNLGLLDIKDGKLVRTAKALTTTNDIPSMAIKNHHLGNLRLAEKALFNEAVERRVFGSITMPTNP
jgi:DNA-binding FadR family transcriptional regulator